MTISDDNISKTDFENFENFAANIAISQYPVSLESGNLLLEETQFPVFSLCFGQISKFPAFSLTVYFLGHFNCFLVTTYYMYTFGARVPTSRIWWGERN